MSEKKTYEFLKEIGQEHLLSGFAFLSNEKKEAFWNQLSAYPKDLLSRQRKAIFSPKKTSVEFTNCFPVSHVSYSGNKELISYGEKRISEKKLGCIVLAGGQATRLGASSSKALVPVTRFRNKSLLQLLIEKVKAASLQAECDLPLAIMTSASTHQEISLFLKNNAYFGMRKEQVFLYTQESLPIVDEKGNWALSAPGCLAESPDGNGRALELFMKSSTAHDWKRQGVTDVNVIFIDNPLADPFDPELCAYLEKNFLDVAIKATSRKDPDEKVGVFFQDQNKVRVIEYTELPSEMRFAKTSQGELLFPFANIGLFCFSLSFLEKFYAQGQTPSMPWHVAQKKARLFADGKEKVETIYKLETFLFDILDYAEKAALLAYPRDQVFAPLKNATGEDSLESVQEKLLRYDRKVYEKISGVPAPDAVFELDPQFYYPTEDILRNWKGKPLPIEGYVDSKNFVR